MLKLKFEPNLLLTIVAIAAMALFLSLGFWQLDRAKEKEQILADLQQKLQSQPISLQRLSGKSQERQYQPVQFSGIYDNKQQFLLDNRTRKGRAGYEVITPVKIPDIKKWVLVNRGWIRAGHDRRLLPKLKSVFGSQTIHGIIRMPLAKGFVLKAENLQQEKWPKRLQQLDFKLIAQELNQPVYPFVVLLDKNANHGFVRDWKFINMIPAKHIGYAVQWFAFAAVLFIIYFALSVKRRENRDDRTTTNHKAKG